ncbi:unnamed protein product [Caenorhabditis bovis]|uniref:Uncharacterized protein n=1 Tax=Caenorhabditis bovis TaxID=2654633 RepID=A0A8S1F781_9PELO|nr:unnamed protein product [Caenorhabditis bovis]
MFLLTISSGYSQIENLQECDKYAPPIEFSLLDYGFPALNTVAFYAFKSQVSRAQHYSNEDQSVPTTFHRINKTVTFHTVSLIAAIFASLLKMLGSLQYITVINFLIAGHTPFVMFVTMRSILRKKSPTRPCFLLCCFSEEDTDTPLPTRKPEPIRNEVIKPADSHESDPIDPSKEVNVKMV